MVKYYDWPATFSRQTGTQGEICFVVGARGVGKTYGLRKQAVKDWQKDGSRFVEICRYQKDVPTVAGGYFAKFEEKREFPQLVFKVQGNQAFAAKRPADGGTPEWDVIGYFVALTDKQILKRVTFAKVKRLIFDEAVLDRHDRYHKYLPNEYADLANVLSSILREEPGKPTKGKLYLLGNSCDLLCPYFQNLGINEPPRFGYTFYKRKSVLLHYVEPWDSEERRSSTLVGRMLADHEEANTMFCNEFTNGGNEYVEERPNNAIYDNALTYRGHTFAFWEARKTGIWYVTERIPRGQSNVIALTMADNTIDYTLLPKASEYARFLRNLFYSDCLRFETPALREKFYDVMQFLGVSW